MGAPLTLRRGALQNGGPIFRARYRAPAPAAMRPLVVRTVVARRVASALAALPVPSLASLALASLAAAQGGGASAVFVGRFDCTSLDAPNERAGGSLTALSGFDLGWVTPGPQAVARAWAPTTALQAMWGDPIGDADYTKFNGYFPNDWDWSGPFVRFADRGVARLPVFWTVRDDRPPGARFDVFAAAATQVVAIRGGDFFRFTHNGNVEFFLRRSLVMKASGVDPLGRLENDAADCLVQDSQGNLYWSPPEAGDWILGNDPAAPVFCSRAGIVMLDAVDITYDLAGNVQDVRADAAHVIFGGYLQGGPNGQPSVHDLVANAAAMDYAGNPIASTASGYYNTVGLALDPLGGTVSASIPRLVGANLVYDTVPNLLFHSDNGTHAATVFSTRVDPTNLNPGALAVINGVKFGSDLLGVPATGTWWGVQQNAALFQPTLMGFALIDRRPVEPFAADAPRHGAILPTDPSIDIDLYPGPSAPTFLLLSVGPFGPGRFQPALPLPGSFSALGFGLLYPVVAPTLTIALGLANPAGYAAFSIANPMNPSHLGIALLFQGVRVRSGSVELSTPVQVQFK